MPVAAAPKRQARPKPPRRSAATPACPPALLSAPAGSARRSSAKPLANPSRQLVLERREALSRRGKRADTSSDRTRQELMRSTQPGPFHGRQ